MDEDAEGVRAEDGVGVREEEEEEEGAEEAGGIDP